MVRGLVSLAALALVAIGCAQPAAAEATTLRAAKQYGLGYVQFMIMEDLKLVEKHAQAAGLADVKGASALNSMPLALNVRNPDIKSLKDFGETDRIAMPAVRVSMQAILLQMACEKEFGPGKHGKLDHIAITMAHPDATIAMLTAQRDVTANFSSVPFQYRQQKQAGIRQLMTSTDILGAPVAFNIVATTTKLRTENPKLYAAFLVALREATAMVNKDKKWAAEAYLRISKDKMPLDELIEIVSRPDVEFTTKLTPIDSIIQFMARTGNYKNKPISAAELLSPEAL